MRSRVPPPRRRERRWPATSEGGARFCSCHRSFIESVSIFVGKFGRAYAYAGVRSANSFVGGDLGEQDLQAKLQTSAKGRAQGIALVDWPSIHCRCVAFSSLVQGNGMTACTVHSSHAFRTNFQELLFQQSSAPRSVLTSTTTIRLSLRSARIYREFLIIWLPKICEICET